MVRKRRSIKQVKKTDEFIMTTTDKISSYFQENAKFLLLLSVGIVVGIGISIIVYFYKANLNQKALLLEAEACKYYQNFTSAGEDGQRALELFKEIISDYPRTQSAQLAQYYIGNYYYNKKDYAQTISAYQNFLDKYSQNRFLKPMVLQGLGYAYEAKNEYEEAIKAFQKIIELPHGFLKAEAYLSIGRCYEALSNKTKAIDFYQQAISKFPNPDFINEIRGKIENIESELKDKKTE